jgi:hypothetical protein
LNNPDYDIQFVEPIQKESPKGFNIKTHILKPLAYGACLVQERISQGSYEHSFLNPTLQDQLKEKTNNLRKKYGFSNGQTR